jgi:hypothetical protein
VRHLKILALMATLPGLTGLLLVGFMSVTKEQPTLTTPAIEPRSWKFHAMSEGPALRETCLNGDRIYALANAKDEYPRALAVVKAGCKP